MPERVDVVVVGAGLAGLTAARHLEAAGLGVAVVEAAPRVGGRAIGRTLRDGTHVDLGAQWIGRTHHHLRALADALGARRVPAPTGGATVLVHEGTRSTFAGDFPPFVGDPPPVAADELADATRVLAELDALATTVDLEAPWRTPDAATLDATTLDAWLARRGARSFSRFVVTAMARIGGAGAFEPPDVSVLHWLVTLRSAPQAEDPEAELFVDGAAGFATRLAGSLARPVVVGQPIRQISWTDGVEVVGATRRWRADAVIVAVPPAVVPRVWFEPELPPARRQLHRELPMGSLIKVQAVYREPFWRAHDLSGTAVGDLPTISFVADGSASDAAGLLTAFVAGDRATAVSCWPPAARRRAILADLVTYFGPEATDPHELVELVEHDWIGEPWIGGAFTAHPRPGAWTAHGPSLRPPVGPIVWAGAETATAWAGFMEGAVRSGQDAARTVLAGAAATSTSPRLLTSAGGAPMGR